LKSQSLKESHGRRSAGLSLNEAVLKSLVMHEAHDVKAQQSAQSVSTMFDRDGHPPQLGQVISQGVQLNTRGPDDAILCQGEMDAVFPDAA